MISNKHVVLPPTCYDPDFKGVKNLFLIKIVDVSLVQSFQMTDISLIWRSKHLAFAILFIGKIRLA